MSRIRLRASTPPNKAKMTSSSLTTRLMAQKTASSNKMAFLVVVLAGLTIFLAYFTWMTPLNTTQQNRAFLDRGLEDPTETATSDDRLEKLLKNDPAWEMNTIPAPEFHLVVSTGCSIYQDWQSYVLFYHAMKSGQVRRVLAGNHSYTNSNNMNHHNGNDNDNNLSYVTRVVSGCTSDQATKMNEHHERYIAPMAPGRFFIHHTPGYQL